MAITSAKVTQLGESLFIGPQNYPLPVFECININELEPLGSLSIPNGRDSSIHPSIQPASQPTYGGSRLSWLVVAVAPQCQLMPLLLVCPSNFNLARSVFW